MKCTQLALTFLALVFSGSVRAGIPGLASAYTSQLAQTRNLLAQTQLLTSDTPSTCRQQLLNISSDNIIDITLGFGYMDVSQGQEASGSFYQSGDVLDQDAKDAFETILTSSCLREHNYACGFHKAGAYLVKRMRNRLTGRNMQVNIQLLSPSITSNDSQNKNRYLAEQQRSSQQAKAHFLSALQTADAVIYLGHARSGGGPDFLPPVLTANGHVDYSSYRRDQAGIRAMVAALNQAPRPTPLLGLLACKSTDLFARSIRRASPGSILVSADALFDYNDILPTGYAILEAVISQRCSDDFEKVIRVQPSSARFIDIGF